MAKLQTLESLTQEQRQVVETWGRGIAVTAGAGSGKTTTLMVKCAEFLKRNPEGRFAAVSFTEKSASDLRKKLSQAMDLKSHWVMTIHGLCGSILRDFPIQAGFQGDERVMDEVEAQAIWERSTEALWADDLPPELAQDVDALLDRERRADLLALILRYRTLNSLGAYEFEPDGDLARVRRITEYVDGRFTVLKKRIGAIDFSDLELAADRALDHEEVRAYYRNRFDLVMVDEFQDTNPIQARILFRFVREDFSNLCVVGDPKQSIYRFRDADVSLFQEVCEKMPVSLSLTWNFRSQPKIIQFCNEFCSPLFQASQLPYEALEPKGKEFPDVKPVEFLENATPEGLASWVRSEIDRGVPTGDFAILLRSIRGAESWLKAISREGIPIAIGSGGFFWEDPRVRELIALLRFWDDPNHALSAAVFFRAPWVGFTDQELDDWIFSKEAGRLWSENFFQSSHPLAQALSPLRKKAARPGEVLMALLINDAIESELGVPLLGLWHRCEELSSRGYGFSEVVEEISQARDENRREREVPPPRRNSAQGADAAVHSGGLLSVMTIHGSKGLEFPHVILLDFKVRQMAPPLPMLFWDRTRGAYLSPRDEAGKPDKNAAMAWRDRERSLEISESKRQLYVGLTRAEKRLILAVQPEAPAPVTQAASKKPAASAISPLLKPSWKGWLDEIRPGAWVSRTDLSQISPSEAQDRPTLFPDFRQAQARLVPKATPTMKTRQSVTEWNRLAQCLRQVALDLASPNAAQNWAQSGENETSELWQEPVSGLSQRELGTRVHEVLEKQDWAALENLEKEAGSDRVSAKKIRDWALKSEEMAQDLSRIEAFTEWSFEVPVADTEGNQTLLVGSIDRLVKKWDGGLVLVDFKVTEKNLDSKALLESYRAQIWLYAYAISKFEKSSYEKLSAKLVAISSKSVSEVQVDLPKESELQTWVQGLMKDQGLLSQKKPLELRALPGSRCRYCAHRSLCPDRKSAERE
ncbi:MAG: UvrD-helicase domain-containing protein [Bdellovibrionales bacterium]|nr:UvrD-helicase domain-containing protein [Bdellovibrionales bacterium]